MRRTSRVHLVHVNKSKAQKLKTFLHLCRDITQYFVDVFWASKDFSSKLASKETTDLAKQRFGITTRLAQCLSKQAKEAIRSSIEKSKNEESKPRRPRIRRHTTTLYYHFVTLEPFQGAFDLAVKFIGSGAPRMVVPVNYTSHLRRFLANGWQLARTIRLGRDRDEIWVDLILEKEPPPPKTSGGLIGMDSNAKNGLVFSDGRMFGTKSWATMAKFGKRRKHTFKYAKDLVGQTVREIDLTGIKVLCVENLKHVKRHTRGKFPRSLNRRLSHWLYAYTMDLLERKCEIEGVRLERKDPWKTSQFCLICRKWDRRNRKGDRFECVHCEHSDHADLNASKNLELLGLAGAYSLRSLLSSEHQSSGQP